jgi:hypothetical protein
MRSIVNLSLYLFVLALIISGAKATCCGEGGCYAGGKCCKDSTTWYIGCKSVTGEVFCPDDVLGGCLVCQCPSPSLCKWAADPENNLCEDVPTCKVCKYEGKISNPSSSACEDLVCPQLGDSDCDGEPDETDECPGTSSCATMDEDALGCSIEQAKELSSSSIKVPGLEPNVFSFLIAVLALTALLAYNFERTS